MRWTCAECLHFMSSCPAEAREQKRVPSLTRSRVPRSTQIQAILCKKGGFPGGTVVKNPPAMQETQVQFLGWEGSLEQKMATHFQHPCLGNPKDRGTWWLQSIMLQESDTTEQLRTRACKMRQGEGREAEAVLRLLWLFLPANPTGMHWVFRQQCPSSLVLCGCQEAECGALDFCLCRPLSHGVLLGPSFTAAHGLTPAKAVFR